MEENSIFFLMWRGKRDHIITSYRMLFGAEIGALMVMDWDCENGNGDLGDI